MERISIVEDHAEATSVAEAVRQAVARAVASEGTPVEHLSLILTDHETVLELNQSYLEHDYLTDVLAFDLREDTAGPIDGEVYVDLDTAREYCDLHNESFEREVARYAVHGTLHLIGYGDTTPEGKAAMTEREDRYLAG